MPGLHPGFVAPGLLASLDAGGAMIDAEDLWWTWAHRMPLSPTRVERGNAKRRELLVRIRDWTMAYWAEEHVWVPIAVWNKL